MVTVHIGVELLAVLLLFRLNVIENLTGLRIGELKNGGVVERRNVLFGGEHILTEQSIGFAVFFGGVIRGGAVIVVGVFKFLGRLRDGAVHHGCDRLQVILFNLSHGGKEGFQFGCLCHIGILLIFGDAEFFLAFCILEQAVFFLCERHFAFFPFCLGELEIARIGYYDYSMCQKKEIMQ